MPAVYVTREDLEHAIGKRLLVSLYSEPDDEDGDDDPRIDMDIEAASAMTQLYAASRGYTVGDTLPDDSAGRVLRMATIGAIVHMAYGRGEKSVPLPESWDDHPARRAYTDMLRGDLPLPTLPIDTTTSVGGWSFSRESATDLGAVTPRRTSRRNMAGY